MTFEEFQATRQPCTDEIWEIVKEVYIEFNFTRDEVFVYDGEYVLHENTEGFHPHAWWYDPAPKPTREEAEQELFEWRAEFT